VKIPEIGDRLYGYQWKGNRVGELEFICATQEHVCKNLKTLEKEIDDTWEENVEEGHDPEPIVYLLVRIK